MIVEVSEEEMNSITHSILKRYGIDFTCYEPKSLRRRIIRLLNRLELTSIHELWMHFLKTPHFINIFMNEISVGMTSMFRDPILWKQLRIRLVSDFAEQNLVNIWHAGCSTGEEVFSMGILLDQTKISNRARSVASDFNRDALEEAKAGVYHKIKMIENEKNYRSYSGAVDFSKYYKATGTDASMDLGLVRQVTFEYRNLITDEFERGFDIIFCRNVMIYFDAIAKVRMLEKFHNALKPKGLLIIGFFDTMSHLIDNQQFRLVDEQAKIFQKL